MDAAQEAEFYEVLKANFSEEEIREADNVSLVIEQLEEGELFNAI